MDIFLSLFCVLSIFCHRNMKIAASGWMRMFFLPHDLIN